MRPNVDLLRLPSQFLAECMADAERKIPTSDFEFHEYLDAGDHKNCVAIFEDEILVVTGEEASNSKWTRVGKRESAGIADVLKYLNYIQGSQS